MATAPYKKVHGFPGVSVAAYSTPTCDKHLDAEQAGEFCPYCALADLVDACNLMCSSGNGNLIDNPIAHARKVLKRKGRR